jgi:hypothetical protein
VVAGAGFDKSYIRELREHALGIAQLGRPEIVTLERPDNRFG